MSKYRKNMQHITIHTWLQMTERHFASNRNYHDILIREIICKNGSPMCFFKRMTIWIPHLSAYKIYPSVICVYWCLTFYSHNTGCLLVTELGWIAETRKKWYTQHHREPTRLAKWQNKNRCDKRPGWQKWDIKTTQDVSIFKSYCKISDKWIT